MAKTIKNIGLYVLTLMLMMCAIELYLQFSEIELSYHELNPDVGKKIRKDAKIIMIKEGFYLGESNEFGYLGPGYPPEKKDNVFRIALMGDSFTEGFQLFERYHFRHILEKELKNNSGKDVQVLNFGVGGFNFSDMYIYYLNYASAFKPDLVIYIVRPNDMIPQPNFIPAPYLYLNHNELKINYDFRKGTQFIIYQEYRVFFEHSSFLKMLNNVYKLIKQGYLPGILFDKLYVDLYLPLIDKTDPAPTSEEHELKDNFLLPETTKKIIDNLGKDRNVYFLYRSSFPNNLNKYIVDAGIKTIDSAPPLNALRKKGIDPIYWKASKTKGHWNHQAHAAIGKYLAEILRPSIP